MKKFTYLAFAAFSILAIASCKKTVIDMNANNGNNTSGSSAGNGNNSNGSNSSVKFDWTGTAPISVKLDGVPYECDEANINIEEAGGGYTIYFYGNDEGNMKGPVIQIKANATPGSVYNMPNGYAGIGYRDIGQGIYWSCFTSGHLKIVTNDATTIEGYFYGDLVDATNYTVVKGKLTEGYFKVTKP
jgi:hypothetical protein